MRAILICLVLGFPPSAMCGDNLEYAIVSGVESIQRVRTGSSLFPWEHAAPDEIIVSLSCGFARVEYARVTTPGFSSMDDDLNPKPWNAFVHLGHYCKLQEFVLDGLHLVAYRKWRGKNYLIGYADILVGEDKRLYVDDSSFIEEMGLESLAGPAAQSGDSKECAVPGPECANQRIYVDTIPMQASKSLR